MAALTGPVISAETFVPPAGDAWNRVLSPSCAVPQERSLDRTNWATAASEVVFSMSWSTSRPVVANCRRISLETLRASSALSSARRTGSLMILPMSAS